MEKIKEIFDRVISHPSSRQIPCVMVEGCDEMVNTQLLLMLKEYYKKKGYFVVYLDCRSFVENAGKGFLLLADQLGISIEQFTERCFFEIDFRRTLSFFKKEKNSEEGQCIVLLDDYCSAPNEFLINLRSWVKNNYAGAVVAKHLDCQRDVDVYDPAFEDIFYGPIVIQKNVER